MACLNFISNLCIELSLNSMFGKENYIFDTYFLYHHNNLSGNFSRM